MIDANGTRYHLLLGYGDWSRCRDDQDLPLRKQGEALPPGAVESGIAWDDVWKVVTLRPELFQFAAGPGDRRVSVEDRRGAARDGFGNWYWIAESRTEILVNSAGSQNTSHFWAPCDGMAGLAGRPGDFHPLAPPGLPKSIPFSGLTVTENHYLVVGTLDPLGLLVFDLYGGGAPQQILWPAAVDFDPFDVAPAPGGGVWILDRTHRRYWALDRHFQVLRDAVDRGPGTEEVFEDFQPEAGGARRKREKQAFPTGFPLAAKDPIGIAALPDGTVIVLDRNPGEHLPLIYWYRYGQQQGSPVSAGCLLRVLAAENTGDFQLDAQSFCYVSDYNGPDGIDTDRVYIVGTEGNQAFAFHLSKTDGQLQLEALNDYIPMRLYEGKGLVAAGTQAYYDFADRWIPLISQRRPRYVESSSLVTSLDRPFDGKEPDCVWHRLLLDACIPSDTRIDVWSRAANEPNELESEPWTKEPPLYLRDNGSELPWVEEPTVDGRGTWELLIQGAMGRYLQLKLQLSGNGRSTPHLRALRIYYPRFSYLDHYLPAVYRDDEESASFLERFLANLEGFYTSIEGRIAAVQMLFDSRSALPEELGWLAGWFGVALDPAWDEARRRLFIRNAMLFFQYRGTPHGLRMALRLALDPCADESLFSERDSNERFGIRIVEAFRLRRTPSTVPSNPSQWNGIHIVSAGGRWTPDQGTAILSERYRKALGLTGSEEYPIVRPSDAQRAKLWLAFSRQVLGFVPSVSASDANDWAAFLMRRYKPASRIQQDYPNYSSPADVPVPTALPSDKNQLLNWYVFESIIAMRRAAHRFSVLIPLPKRSRSDAQEQQRRRNLARRVVELEKPAHTVFEVRYYWALFRVGEARLGQDTVLDLGSRSPELMSAMILGQGHLAENYLASAGPDAKSGRLVAGDGRCTVCGG